nr:cell death abnormality protein 1-like [Crassostrea gigas]
MYVSNTDDIQGSTLCYKDGRQLPPLNFTTTCTEHGRYVIFYNERLNKESYPEGYEVYNVFTELCEVIVQGCKRSDVFGIDCDNPCPANCICMIENGSCLKCKTGWSGTFCDIECMESWYNVNSSQKCVGHCRENSTCNQVTGQCESDAQLGGQEHYVRKNVLSPMEKIVNIRAVYIASTRHVTDSTETVCVMTNMKVCRILRR